MDLAARQIVFVGPFGLQPKATVRARALPLAKTLVARGWRVTIILPPWDDPAQSGQEYVDDGVTIRQISLPRRLQLWGIVHRLRSAIRNANPDIVHLFKPKGYSALAVLGLERRYHLVVDTDDWEGTGGWNLAGNYTPAQRALFSWQEHDLPRRAGATTAASRTLETQLWGFGLPRDQVTYLPNGLLQQSHGHWRAALAAAPAIRAELGLETAPTVLLYTRFVEFPPSRPVAIFTRIRQALPEARLLVVGDGLHGEESEMLREAQRAGLTDAIVHRPWAAIDNLPATLAAGDVAILPYDDTLINRAKCSVKSLDLMAAARPIVADAVGQNCEYLEHQQSGLLTAPGDDTAFANAVVELLRDPARRAALGQAAARRAWHEFAWDRLVERVETVYDTVAQQQRSRRLQSRERTT